MQSLKELYKIGKGPSSSHSIGPDRAARRFAALYPTANRYRVVLFGSLAFTGRGHMTDRVIEEAFAPIPCEIEFDRETPCDVHPNTMDFYAYRDGELLGKLRVFSVGGGTIQAEGEVLLELPEIYSLSTYSEIAEYCRTKNMRIWQYVEECEGKDIWEYLAEIWRVMKRSVDDGLSSRGVLPGCLGTQRKANHLYNQRHIDESAQTRENRMVCSYAFAVSEQNASGGTIVTAPTCGACGVVPSVLCYMQQTRHFSDLEILHALATGGIIGNLIKTNASISGAECGCQAEVGSACSMAAAALAELFEMGLDQIECAAEIAMEHHLGLTCDPIAGLVQIPCIERNAVAAMRAINALSLANFLWESRKIGFDMIVKTMYETGKHLHIGYRETSEEGLAKYYPL